MAGPRLIAVVGKKNSGKTTLLVALAKDLTRRGHRVMTIKHGSHPVDLDREGTDTWRHIHEGDAEAVLMETPGSRFLIGRPKEALGPRALAERYLSDAEFVLVEGFKDSDLPKIEVYRRAVHPEPIYKPGTPGAEHFLGVITDDRSYRAEIPVMRFTDTAWMYRLVDLVIQGST